jgi:hypothetical protein
VPQLDDQAKTNVLEPQLGDQAKASAPEPQWDDQAKVSALDREQGGQEYDPAKTSDGLVCLEISIAHGPLDRNFGGEP